MLIASLPNASMYYHRHRYVPEQATVTTYFDGPLLFRTTIRVKLVQDVRVKLRSDLDIIMWAKAKSDIIFCVQKVPQVRAIGSLMFNSVL